MKLHICLPMDQSCSDTIKFNGSRLDFMILIWLWFNLENFGAYACRLKCCVRVIPSFHNFIKHLGSLVCFPVPSLSLFCCCLNLIIILGTVCVQIGRNVLSCFVFNVKFRLIDQHYLSFCVKKVGKHPKSVVILQKDS